MFRILLWRSQSWRNAPLCSRSRLVVITQGAKPYTHIVALSTMAGKNFIGRLGAELDCAPVTDVLAVVDEETFVRPMYAGNAVATVRAAGALKLLTIRPTSFEKAATWGGSASIEPAISPVDGADAGLASFVSKSVSGGDRPDLTAARVVVSGGRGMKDGDNFKILEKLADKLGGAIGASRAAVDAGFVPNELQVNIPEYLLLFVISFQVPSIQYISEHPDFHENSLAAVTFLDGILVTLLFLFFFWR